MPRRKSTASPEERKQLTERIRRFLEGRPEIKFAYIHGSFLGEPSFSDIDLAVYLGEPAGSSSLLYELGLETELEEVLGYPVDVRVINTAPLSFRYGVLRRGRLIFDRDPEARAEFQARSLKAYFDFAPVRRRCFEEMSGVEI